MGLFGIGKDVKFLHAENRDSDKTVPVCRLISVFIRCTCRKLGFLTFHLRCLFYFSIKPRFGYSLAVPQSIMVNVLKFRIAECLTKWHRQTVQTQIRLLLKEQSDLGLHCLPFYYVIQKQPHEKQNLGQKSME